MQRFLVVLYLLASLSCSKVAVDMSDLACGEDGCLEGWVCHPEKGVCVQEIAIGCDDDTSYCPSIVQTGDACSPLAAFLPCAYGVEDCSAGCRTCEADGWSECTPGECTLGELTSCGGCDDDCTVRVQNADPSCNTAGGAPVCDYAGDCYAGYRDGDGSRANGCETVCVQSNGGVETCDGQDNDCNGNVDDIGEVSVDCNGQVVNAHVSVWSCPAGSCTVVTCETNFWDIANGGADGCEYPCTLSNSGNESCDGHDNDCNNVEDDVPDPTADCFAILPDDEPEVSVFACIGGSCEITGCNAGYVDLNGTADDGCEETCTETNGGVERCDGLDNDCDGTPNNADQGADLCTEFFLDVDDDGSGVTGDSQCWCTETGNYRATVAGDCDDAVATCVADCITNVDNDGVRDCEDTCIDGDNDGYGTAGGAGNTCTNADCDDAVGTCNADCITDVDSDGRDCEDACIDADGDGYGSPGGAGNTCSGTDCAEGVVTCNVDCTTDADNDAIRDCEDTCLDADGDGYGVAGGGGDTCAGGDCDDDPTGCGTACHEGLVEICDNQDNDCLSGIDDGLDGVCACVGGATPPLPPEDCGTGAGNGVDDNCNDAIDEGCGPTHIQPSNLGAGVNTCQGAEDLVVGAGVTATIDTDWPATLSGVVLSGSGLVTEDIDQGGTAPHISVFYFRSITIAATGTLVAEGGPALALVACDHVTIDGDIDACATGITAGPGGGAGGGSESDGSGVRPGAGGPGDFNYPHPVAGGGGGGYCRAGGDGGDSDGVYGSGSTYTGGTGGAVYVATNAETLVPLRGGSGGGGGGNDPIGSSGFGGGGGGALQIVANSAITVGGGINACGGGGGVDTERWGGGGGGGSGGAILLEAPLVTLTGTLAANGGGGGGGDASYNTSNARATAGDAGYLSSTTAAGGTGGSGGYGDGGNGGLGGADSGSAAAGDDGQDNNAAGGGGGGVGFVRINADSFDGSGTVSPDGPTCYTTGSVVYQ